MLLRSIHHWPEFVQHPLRESITVKWHYSYNLCLLNTCPSLVEGYQHKLRMGPMSYHRPWLLNSTCVAVLCFGSDMATSVHCVGERTCLTLKINHTSRTTHWNRQKDRPFSHGTVADTHRDKGKSQSNLQNLWNSTNLAWQNPGLIKCSQGGGWIGREALWRNEQNHFACQDVTQLCSVQSRRAIKASHWTCCAMWTG